MGGRRLLRDRPVYRQLTGRDPWGRGRAAMSRRTEELRPRTDAADRVVATICPYCAVRYGQQVYVKDERVVRTEGDPDSPVSRGRPCPKGSATRQLTTGDARRHQVLCRGGGPVVGGRHRAPLRAARAPAEDGTTMTHPTARREASRSRRQLHRRARRGHRRTGLARRPPGASVPLRRRRDRHGRRYGAGGGAAAGERPRPARRGPGRGGGLGRVPGPGLHRPAPTSGPRAVPGTMRRTRRDGAVMCSRPHTGNPSWQHPLARHHTADRCARTGRPRAPDRERRQDPRPSISPRPQEFT